MSTKSRSWVENLHLPIGAIIFRSMRTLSITCRLWMLTFCCHRYHMSFVIAWSCFHSILSNEWYAPRMVETRLFWLPEQEALSFQNDPGFSLKHFQPGGVELRDEKPFCFLGEIMFICRVLNWLRLKMLPFCRPPKFNWLSARISEDHWYLVQ